MDVEKLGIYDNKATYVQIKTYMKEKYGFEETNLYIAQVKEKVGLGKRDNYNIGNERLKFHTVHLRRKRQLRMR